MIVTTRHEAPPEVQEQARTFACKFGVRFVERKKMSIARLHEMSDYILVVTDNGLRAYSKGTSEPFFFHPGMAMLRIKRLLNGDTDVMVQACGLRKGDSFLDCTLGLAADSIVASFVVGVEGRIVGLESERIPGIIVEEGLKRYESPLQEAQEAMRRIEVVPMHHLTFLRQCENNSFDIVYFDPMFFQAIVTSESIAPLRPFANYESLSLAAIEEAKRVARRRIVMKNHRESPDFENFGFMRFKKMERAFTYGIIEVGGEAE
ncbi:class I SAM-dependent methyltransferase [Aneurinibacillus aneurinilyticus]|uniref:class I SAM-dependent methyltransferase n=1 Tax=Aneurinibacillus aneurinilyticus TaxID=1391 RepID=UPI003525CECF